MNDDPFKFKTKYVVDKLPDGKKVRVGKRNDGCFVEPYDVFDDELIDNVSNREFEGIGYVCGNTLYVQDLISYERDDLTHEPWHQRFVVMRNEFDWRHTVRYSRPLVVTSEEEMDVAFDIYKHVPDSRGVIVWGYKDEVPRDKKVVIFDE